MYWLNVSFFVNSINYSLFIIFQCTKVKTTAMTIKKMKNANNALQSGISMSELNRIQILNMAIPIMPPKRKPIIIPHPVALLICSFISFSIFLFNKKPTTGSGRSRPYRFPYMTEQTDPMMGSLCLFGFYAMPHKIGFRQSILNC